MTQRMTADDLFTGLFAVLAQHGFTSFSIRTDRVDTSMKAVFDALTRRADELDLNLRFTVQPNAYGESATVREGLANASLRGLVSFDNPEFQHVRLQPDKVDQIVNLTALPGGRALYEDLAATFIEHYEGNAAVG